MSEIRWAIIGGIFGVALTCLSILIGIQFPSREILGSVFSNQFWFDLLNPATGLLVAMAVLFIAVKRLSGSSRKASLALFTCFVTAFIILTVVGTWLRGPNWDFFWPWQSWPEMPARL
jgi:hypothetical protein